MTPNQVNLIKTSWQQVAPIADAAAELFYNRLFTLDPKLKPMFNGDMHAQGRKLMTMIATVVNGLDRLEFLVPAIQDLGRRHVAYGVADKDYDTVGAALLWTLEQGLGPAFTTDVRDAWAAAYGVLAETMKEAARKVA